MKQKLIWLDDCRDPFACGNTWIETYSPIGTDVEVIWCQNYDEFDKWINANGLPDAICFDHDLGDVLEHELHAKGISKKEARKRKQQERTGYDAAKKILDFCMDKDIRYIPYAVQSSNEVGKENIVKLIENYNKFFDKNHE